MRIKQAVVLCAGEGTRMLPDTADKPKCLLDVAGKVVIERIATWCRGHGVQQLFVNLHYKPEPVLDLFRTNRNFGMEAILLVEKRVKGTAGGITNFLDKLDEDFFVVYGDILTNLDLKRLDAAHRGNYLTMTSHEVDNPSECGVIVEGPGNTVGAFVEKPAPGQLDSRRVNAGVMAMSRSLASTIARGGQPDIARDVVPFLVGGPFRAHHMPLLDSEWLIDVGTRGNYERACRIFSETNT